MLFSAKEITSIALLALKGQEAMIGSITGYMLETRRMLMDDLSRRALADLPVELMEEKIWQRIKAYPGWKQNKAFRHAHKCLWQGLSLCDYPEKLSRDEMMHDMAEKMVLLNLDAKYADEFLDDISNCTEVQVEQVVARMDERYANILGAMFTLGRGGQLRNVRKEACLNPYVEFALMSAEYRRIYAAYERGRNARFPRIAVGRVEKRISKRTPYLYFSDQNTMY